MGALVAAIIGILMIPLCAMMNGVAVEALWAWFIEPLGAPAIGVAHAMGIALFVTFMQYKIIPTKDNERRSFLEIMVTGLVQQAVVVGFFLLWGSVIKSYM